MTTIPRQASIDASWQRRTRVTSIPPRRLAPRPVCPYSPTMSATAEDDLRDLSGPSTAVFAAPAGPEHALETANEAFLATFGADPARLGTVELDRVYRTGETVTVRDVAVAGASFDLTY